MITTVRGNRCRLAPEIIRFVPAIAVAAVLFAAGCAAPSATAPVAPSAVAPLAGPALRKGLSAGELKALLGEPKEVRPYVVEGVPSEIWIYERRIPGVTRQVPVRMQEVPYVDPITGDTRMIQEPVYENERTTIIETTDVLMFSGAVAEWKTKQVAERDFN